MSLYSGGVLIVEVVRSGVVESRHHGSVAVLGPGGTLVASAGDPYGAIFPRSANKPMQATGMLRSGVNLEDPADLALIAASHHAEPMHVERVLKLLAKAGLSESDLRCPPDLPLSEAARAQVLHEGGGRARRYMNCSGKHAGMLLACRAGGWPTETYLDPDHPVQRSCRVAVEDLASEKVQAIGVDGCGAPIFAISLIGLARAFLTVVSAEPSTPHRAVADAMRAWPEMSSGTLADDARLMRAWPGLLSKGGAEGVLGIAVPGHGAVAVKIDDGNPRARLPVLVAALRRLGVRAEELDSLAAPVVLGGGRPVGEVKVASSCLR